MDESIKEGMVLALNSIRCLLDGEGAMLGCGGSLQRNYGIWERRGLFHGVSQRELM